MVYFSRIKNLKDILKLFYFVVDFSVRIFVEQWGCYEIKTIGQTIDTFESDKKFHTVITVMNYRFVK